MNLAAIGEAAAATASDYKALVCIFLFGGNDYANTVTPYDQPSYDLYAGLRGTIAHAARLARRDHPLSQHRACRAAANMRWRRTWRRSSRCSTPAGSRWCSTSAR